MSRLQRTELFLFLTCWFSFSYFNQGGGWNQNSRFAEIRAMAEEGRFAIDHFLVYRPAGEGGGEIKRYPLERAEYDEGGKRHRLCWVDGTWTFYPVGDHPKAEDTVEEAMHMVCASGDVSYVPHTGHFHPNKPPGTSFMALPAYYLIHRIERALGVNSDGWWTMNLNAWLTTVLSVGLMSAVGCVLFFRLARKFAGDQTMPALLATIALAFGTTFFPFATILFDHALTASVLIASFYCISWDRCGEHRQCALRHVPADVRHVLAGFAAGLAVVTNYVAAGAVVALGLYALFAGRDRGAAWMYRRTSMFILGGLPMAGLLLYYNWACFGSPLALNNDFQNPIFADPRGTMGMFGEPNPYVVALITLSPYRGVFWLAPILILGLVGWIIWLREGKLAAEARLGMAIFGFFFLVNASFNGYHGGFAAGPRYLVPGLPFLALPLVVAFTRRSPFASWKWSAVPLVGGILLALLIVVRIWPIGFTDRLEIEAPMIATFYVLVMVAIAIVPLRQTAMILLVISIAQHLLLVATDAQNALAVGGHARIDEEHRKDDFFCDLVLEYAAPLFFTGKDGPVLRQLAAIKMEEREAKIEVEEPDEATRRAVVESERAELSAAIERGDREPFLLAAIRGPVSVNPLGVYDGLLGYGIFEMDEEPSAWASFNIGEFVFPQSRWSILPLMMISGVLLTMAARNARRIDSESAGRMSHPPG
jgi:hypothetical protein